VEALQQGDTAPRPASSSLCDLVTLRTAGLVMMAEGRAAAEVLVYKGGESPRLPRKLVTLRETCGQWVDHAACEGAEKRQK
jgi:hypothetical protein